MLLVTAASIAFADLDPAPSKETGRLTQTGGKSKAAANLYLTDMT